MVIFAAIDLNQGNADFSPVWLRGLCRVYRDRSVVCPKTDFLIASRLIRACGFVTGDEGQFNALGEITKLAPLNIKMMYYADLR
jgi:hypothetical protein